MIKKRLNIRMSGLGGQGAVDVMRPPMVAIEIGARNSAPSPVERC